MTLGKLTYDRNLGEGAAEVMWTKMPDDHVISLDILSDWIADLTKIYNRELHLDKKGAVR